MCQKCVEAVRTWFPDLPEEHYGDFLLATTAYPFATGEHTAEQVAALSKRSRGNHGKAMSLAAKDMEDDMREYRLASAYDGNPFPEPR